MSSLQVTENQSAAVAIAPRVALADIEAAIAVRFDVTADRVITPGGVGISSFAEGMTATEADRRYREIVRQLGILSLCVLVMKNGFTVVGKSAPASPENFDRELGRKFAYEDAVRQLWPLMGFALRDKLAGL